MNKINFVNNNTPALNAATLNKLQDNVEDAIQIVQQSSDAKLPLDDIKTTETLSDTKTYSCNYINGIIESNSNANGSYVKYIGGTLICRKTVTENISITTSWGGMYEGSMNLGNTPATFINNTYQIALTPQDGSGVLVEQAGVNRTTTSFGTATLVRPNSTTATPKLDIIAIGKWK